MNRKTKTLAPDATIEPKDEPTLQELLQIDEQRRQQAVQAGLEVLLKQHNCQLVGDPVIINGLIQTRVRIQANRAQ